MANLLNEVDALLNEGETDAALRLALQVYQSAPEDALANYYCAMIYDINSQEREAAPHYERALAHGLAGKERRQALLGLGSTYRVLGQHQKSVVILRQGLTEYDDGREFEVFLALTLYCLGDYAQAMELLLRNLAETTQDAQLQDYGQALLYYAKNLDWPAPHPGD
ncbi:tetratricopeptide repeat protein [Nodosilinea sp. PGN35]|uniref:tetratricopeptide repeat protein n=1 Tax=Nodosilinea sp. PGN35 TaxID=3020489 RepID=UPI0023B2CE8E|nr:tetratricopeptide repeat protein [Nodosilinea sp. TSF1-S3]MDF0365391.1 tetratricopeptide repeat protein [Nodosilinea sp. TSF1-S3]